MLSSLFTILFCLQATSVEKGTLTIEVQNIHQTEGMIWLGIYRSAEDFMIKEKSMLIGKEVVQQGNMQLQVDNLPYGDYAFALFHDENNNGTMDQNLIGIPSEPFAFSQKPPSRFRLPTFHEVKFQFRQPHLTIKASLKKWWQTG